ncbi:MAG: hypothetical protein ACLSVD_09710 [Eggerthellaceae bacterium]
MRRHVTSWRWWPAVGTRTGELLAQARVRRAPPAVGDERLAEQPTPTSWKRHPEDRTEARSSQRACRRRWPRPWRVTTRAAKVARWCRRCGASRLPEADIVVNALVGAPARASYETLAAGRCWRQNKESLVVGGDLIMPMAAEPGPHAHRSRARRHLPVPFGEDPRCRACG